MNFSEFFPVWNRLTEAERRQISASAMKKTFLKGTLVHYGDCMGLILVASGRLRAYTVSEDGREITLYRLMKGDICLFSASCMMKSFTFDIAISAETEVELVVIPSEVYKRIMDVSAPLAGFTNEVMAARFSDVMWLMEQVMWKSFDKRLADFLLEESAIEQTGILKITHETIGNHLGNPREVVTRMLKYFQNEGMVKLSRGTIEILDAEKLQSVTQA